MNIPIFSSLRSHLILLVLLCGIPMLILLIYSGLERRNHASDDVRQQAMQMIGMAVSNQIRIVEETRLLLTVLAEAPQIQNGDVTRCESFLAKLLGEINTYANFGVTYPNGDVWCSSVPIKGRVNVNDRAYFQRTLKSLDFSIGNYQIGHITNVATLNFSYPVLDDQKRLKAVLYTALPLNWFKMLTDTFQLPPRSVVNVIDNSTHTLLARYPESTVKVGSSVEKTALVEAMNAAGIMGMTDVTGMDGVERFYAFSRLHDLPNGKEIYLNIGIPKAATYVKANEIIVRNLVIVIFVVMLVLLSARYYCHAIVLRPIMKLLEVTRQVSSGNFDARVEVSDSKNEIAVLSREFNNMAAALVRQDSERKRYITELEYKATHDALTNLPNRFIFQDRLQHALQVSSPEVSSLAVLMINVLRLRDVNNIIGHNAGDLVLKEVASRLQNILRVTDTLARLGGDEFAIVLPTVSLAYVSDIARNIQKQFEQLIDIEDDSIEIEVATGIALYPEHGNNPIMLLHHADIAMHLAENEATRFSIYNLEDKSHNLQHLKLLGELRQALEQKKLVLYYQPQIDIKSGRIIGVEALARWPHPFENKMIPPDEFIPMVELSGLIRPFTLWVLEEAIIQLKRWSEAGIDLSIAVNLSTRNLLDAELPSHIEKLLKVHNISADHLILEVTESALMSRPEAALKVLTQLHEMGHRLSIDDFGTGYSSLSYLKKLPVSEIKIDQSFVFGLTSNDLDAKIVRSTIELAQNMELKVVAEGVEDQAVLNSLSTLNCDVAQGYHMSRPLPVEELEQWLISSPWGLKKDVK